MEPSFSDWSRDQLRSDFASVLRELRGPLLRFLHRYTANEEASADLAQEAFVKAYFQLDRFDDRQPFAPWLFTIAANGARDFLRKHARQGASTGAEKVAWPADHESPDRILVSRERHEAMEEAIAALPAALREPILLHYQLDWPVEAIARHLDLEPGAVKTRLHRARRTLQELLCASKP